MLVLQLPSTHCASLGSMIKRWRCSSAEPLGQAREPCRIGAVGGLANTAHCGLPGNPCISNRVSRRGLLSLWSPSDLIALLRLYIYTDTVSARILAPIWCGRHLLGELRGIDWAASAITNSASCSSGAIHPAVVDEGWISFRIGSPSPTNSQ